MLNLYIYFYFPQFLLFITPAAHLYTKPCTHTGQKMAWCGPDGVAFVVIHSESIWRRCASLSANLPFWWVSMILCPMKSHAVCPTIAYLSYISTEYSPVKKIKPWYCEIISVSYLLPAEMCRFDALQRAEWLSWMRRLIVWGSPHISLFSLSVSLLLYFIFFLNLIKKNHTCSILECCWL